ncbi:MAG: gliding motility-associated C-terminal domain-containing protein [Chitinophagales bacterium]|nr:gliding motility-associated C-terminal domain-containing protein [Chitinophagales bacterium]
MRSFLLLFSFFFLGRVFAQCFSVESILADACGDPEGENEMVSLRVNTDLNLNNLVFDWPNNNFLGWCPDAQLTAALNQTIVSSCGLLIEAPNGIVPAGEKLLIVSSTNMLINANSFEGLSDTIYIAYQCAGNTSGHFSNLASSIRTLQVSYSDASCTSVQAVSYLPTDLIGGDGAAIYYDETGQASYYNTGCNAIFNGLNASWTFPSKICNNLAPLNLNNFLSANATSGGTWSGDIENTNFFNPQGKLGNYTISYTVIDPNSCLGAIDSSLTFEVVAPSFGSDTIERCDSIFQFGFWIYEDTLLEIPVANPNAFLCDSIVQRYYKISKSNFSLYQNSVELYPGESYTFDIIGTNPFSYSLVYPNGDTCLAPCLAEELFAEYEGTYYFLISDLSNSCTSNLSFQLNRIYSSLVNVPTAFTPNKDGQNDLYKVYTRDINDLEYKIYSQWGEEIFIGRSSLDSWDGKFKNKDLASGIFLLHLKASGKDGQSFDIVEKIKLIR